jgi:sugar lactone lactonase YvrE
MFWLLLLAVASMAHAADRPAAVDTFKRLQQQLANDKKAADWNAFLADARQLKAFLNGSPTSSLEVARAQLQLGRTAEALTETRRFVAMGQINAILDTPLFAPLRDKIDAQIRINSAPIALAASAFALPDAGTLPEDIDYDPGSKQFFITSVLTHRIVALDLDGKQRVFADAPDHWPMLALKIDAKRRRLWATEVALEGFTAVASADWGRSALLEFDLDGGSVLAKYEGPPRSSLGDMALAPNGEPIVSDGTGGGIYRLHGGELRRIDHGDFISPQTIAICASERRVFVADYVRGIAAFDLASGSARWLSTHDRHALDGIDGLYCHDRSLMAIQNGASPERVVMFSLDSSRSAIVAEKVIERATPTLGDPTHGVYVGDAFFYIANSGWNALDAHGVVTAPNALTAARVMRVSGEAMKSGRAHD